MHLYHASVYVSNFGRNHGAYARLSAREREMYAEGLQNVLESYHYVKNETFLQAVRADGQTIFLDSGAFSAFTTGVKIDLGAFCDYCHRNADVIRMVSVLDAIGDPDGTWRNQMLMEERGVRPLPCYHYGEPPAVLEWYLTHYPYITIGGMVPVPNNQLELWLDRVWADHLTDDSGVPRAKVHGFGLTSPKLMRKYPWYSVDSSSWQAYGSNGFVLLHSNRALAISAKKGHRKELGNHYDNLAPAEQEAVRRELEEHGVCVEDMRDHHSHRWAWNAWMLPRVVRLEDHVQTFIAKDQRLF